MSNSEKFENAMARAARSVLPLIKTETGDRMRRVLHAAVGPMIGSFLGQIIGTLCSEIGYDATEELLSQFVAEIKRVATT